MIDKIKFKSSANPRLPSQPGGSGGRGRRADDDAAAVPRRGQRGGVPHGGQQGRHLLPPQRVLGLLRQVCVGVQAGREGW